MRCYVCQGRASAAFVACTSRGCQAAGWLCEPCSDLPPHELVNEANRWRQEHLCPRLGVHVFTAATYLRRALADLHCARQRLEQAGLAGLAETLSGRIRPLEQLHELVKATRVSTMETPTKG